MNIDSPPLRGLLVACATILVSTFGMAETSRAQPLRSHYSPPTSCRLDACLEGSYAFVRGHYEEAIEQFEGPLDEQKASPRELGDMLLMSAVAHLRSGAPAEAAGRFMLASSVVDELRAYLDYRALRAFLQTETPPVDIVERLVEKRGALERAYPDRDLVRLRLSLRVRDGSPSTQTVRWALDGDRDSRTEACGLLKEWLNSDEADSAPDARLDAHRARVYGACVDVDDDARPDLEDYEPSAEARVRRAEYLYGAVQYEEALAELKTLEIDGLDDDLRCRARFRLGRTLYRLDRYDASMTAYRRVVETCGDEMAEDERVRSLYAIGRYAYHDDELDESKQTFQTLLADYPERSHADDAILFLTRIHRERDQTEEQYELMERALRDYPGGDMVHEIVWEVLESLYREGDYDRFLDELDSLDLPARDDQYFSQGRLEYFRGQAAMTLEEAEVARRAWREAWRQYPFSFYGYLSHLKLRAHEMVVPELGGDEAEAPPRWFFDSDWSGHGVRRLLSVGLPGMAAELEAGRLAERSDASIEADDRWRLAALHHAAGDVETSHDVARRRIAGRPWVEPAVGRRYRWEIAFPNPYETTLREVVAAEAAQSDASPPPITLLAALIREESGLDADVQSWAGAVGLMQLMPSTARAHDDDIDGTADPERLETPRVNLRVGTDFLFYLAETFDAHPVLMIAGYNAGGGNVRRWLRQSPAEEVGLWLEDVSIRQTRHYVKRIVGSWAAYQWLDGQRRLDDSVAEPID